MNKTIQIILSIPYNIVKYGSIIGIIIEPEYTNVIEPTGVLLRNE